MTEHDVTNLIEEGASIKSEIDAKNKRLREINAILVENATFADGKKSTHLVGCQFKATLAKKEDIVWDQAKMGDVRAALGDEQFFELFVWEYKHKAKKDLDAFIKHNPRANVVKAAMTIKAGTTSVKYEALEE